jgi:hypothetical protein
MYKETVLLLAGTKCKSRGCLGYNKINPIEEYRISGRANNMSLSTIYHEKEEGYKY